MIHWCMQKPKASLLLHPLFAGSLLVLLLNDFYGKYAYPGFLTGKLSDLAGVLVLPVFCRVLFPALPKKAVFMATAVFFTWWKSPFSQPLINQVNAGSPWPVQRVVDYSDLLALGVLPLAIYIAPRSIRLQAAGAVFLRGTVGAVTVFSLCSTSMVRNLFQVHPAMEEVYFGESITVKRAAADVLRNLEAKGVVYRRDSVMYYPIINQHNLYYKINTANDTGTAWQPVLLKNDSTLYVRWEGTPFYFIPEYRSADRTFRNVRFTLSENRKKTKTTVTIQMFQTEGLRGQVAWDKKMKQEYRNQFAGLFSTNGH